MKVQLNTRQRLVAAALLLTLLATAWTIYQEDGNELNSLSVVAPAMPRRIAANVIVPTPQALLQLRTARTLLDSDINNTFAVTRWEPMQAPMPPALSPPAPPLLMPPPVAYVPPPPPPPSAPILPFQYLGRLQEGVTPWRVFLLKGNTVYTVHEGDVLDGVYRVQKIAARQLTFIYLPLQQEQSIAIGEAS